MRSYTELDVYRKADAVARQVFELSLRFPAEERYALTDQVRRPSRSIGAHLAEAWGKRLYRRYFINKLSDAAAEQLETEHWLHTAATCGYISADEKDEPTEKLAEIGRMLHGMIQKRRTDSPGRPRTEPRPHLLLCHLSPPHHHSSIAPPISRRCWRNVQSGSVARRCT